MADLFAPIEALLKRVDHAQLREHFGVTRFDGATEFLTLVALKRGKLGKGGTVDQDAAARAVLQARGSDAPSSPNAPLALAAEAPGGGRPAPWRPQRAPHERARPCLAARSPADRRPIAPTLQDWNSGAIPYFAEVPKVETAVTLVTALADEFDWNAAPPKCALLTPPAPTTAPLRQRHARGTSAAQVRDTPCAPCP